MDPFWADGVAYLVALGYYLFIYLTGSATNGIIIFSWSDVFMTFHLYRPSGCCERARSNRRFGKGFTLIELLIVIAIIAILALIAVPNFLEAQTRAKVARIQSDMRIVVQSLMAYHMDQGMVPPDGNDNEGVAWAGFDFQRETGIPPDLTYKPGYGNRDLTKFAPFNYLTTPIAFMSSVPIDAFSSVMPFTYDTRGYPTAPPFRYAVVISSGPDRVIGDWNRGLNADGRALPYDPTNGTMSPGDYWRAAVVVDDMTYRREYSGFFVD